MPLFKWTFIIHDEPTIKLFFLNYFDVFMRIDFAKIFTSVMKCFRILKALRPSFFRMHAIRHAKLIDLFQSTRSNTSGRMLAPTAHVSSSSCRFNASSTLHSCIFQHPRHFEGENKIQNLLFANIGKQRLPLTLRNMSNIVF